MTKLVVNIHFAKSNFSRLVERAARGEEIIIARAGRPLARLVPLGAPVRPRIVGLLKGRIRIPDDFDAPLSNEALDAFQGP